MNITGMIDVGKNKTQACTFCRTDVKRHWMFRIPGSFRVSAVNICLKCLQIATAEVEKREAEQLRGDTTNE